METYLYDLRHALEETECRAIARRELLHRLWASHKIGNPASTETRILEVGCGTGATLKSFRPCGMVVGLDVHLQALRYSMQREVRHLVQASGTALPFADDSFDLVICMDVLEHLEEDRQALEEIRRVLKPEGITFLIVPSFQSLWSSRDVRLQHKRRYSYSELDKKVRETGFLTIQLAHLDLLAFFPFYFLVKMKSFKGQVADIPMDMLEPPQWINRMLLRWMRFENRIALHLPSPFGISVLCVARKRGGASHVCR